MDESAKKESTDERYIVKAVPKVFGEAETNDSVGQAVNVETEQTTMTQTVDEPAAVIDEQIKSSESLVEPTDVNLTDEIVDGSSTLVTETRIPETPNKTEPDIPSFR